MSTLNYTEASRRHRAIICCTPALRLVVQKRSGVPSRLSRIRNQSEQAIGSDSLPYTGARENIQNLTRDERHRPVGFLDRCVTTPELNNHTRI
jgi:hypothetical protein